jgi:hypothetical protein
MRVALLGFLAIAVLLVGACSAPGEAPQTTTSAAPTSPSAAPTPADTADAYALNLSGGVRTGCLSAAPGPEAESDPGCIYGAAFAGCLEGISGEQVGPLSPEDEYPQEPGLVRIYYQAVEDCGGTGQG